jgi:hypothetical protein
MIDPAKTIKRILREYGHDVLIQRRLDDDFLYSETFEQVTTRHYFPSDEAMAQIQREDIEGVNTGIDLVFYFEADVNPKQNDRIYEEGMNNINGANLYYIDFAAPVRGKFGKIVYWIAGATKERPS